MKKILIADDEFLVRLGLKTTIDWQQHGFVIVGEAKNGKEALELFEEFDPDILLTDIRMPIMGGLELIQAVKQKKSSIKAIILTHYDDFNYAKEAIKLGASDYILKSDLNSDNLFGILSKLSYEIDADAQKADKTDKSQKSDLTDNYQLCRELLMNLVDEGFKSKDDFSKYIQGYKNIFEMDNFIILAGVIRNIGNLNTNRDYQQYEKTINNVLVQSLESKTVWLCPYINKNRVTVLINTSVDNNQIYNSAIIFKQNMNKFLEADITIGLSKADKNPAEIITLLKQARIAQKYCFFDTSGIMFFDNNMIEKTDECPRVDIEELKSYIKQDETEKIKEYILSVFDALEKIKQIQYVKDVFYDLMGFAKIISTDLNLQNRKALNDSKLSYTVFDSLYSFEAVKKYVLDIYFSLKEYSSDNRPAGYSYIIRKSINFIKENYNRNITMSDAAEFVDVSNSYLSLLFKQETGINFSNYLNNYRIEEAKKLLKSSNLKIYEISFKVGFDSPYYFSKVFKDITGTTCKDYKNKSS
jgi:two-component system response regulator YesN